MNSVLIPCCVSVTVEIVRTPSTDSGNPSNASFVITKFRFTHPDAARISGVITLSLLSESICSLASNYFDFIIKN